MTVDGAVQSEQKRVVHATIAPTLSEPRASAPMSSQILRGEQVTLMETSGSWIRLHGEDGYDGWMHEGYLASAGSTDVFSRVSLGCVVLEEDGERRALPFGARLTAASTIVEGRAVALAGLGQEFPADAAAICESAVTLFEGSSYLWGGVTPWGCDCSGFVQRVFRLHGVALPRDAWQQFLTGAAIGSEGSVSDAATPQASVSPLASLDKLRAADLLFFSDREDERITHVGIALDDCRMIHSSLAHGGVAIDAVRGSGVTVHAAKLAAWFRGARRYL